MTSDEDREHFRSKMAASGCVTQPCMKSHAHRPVRFRVAARADRIAAGCSAGCREDAGRAARNVPGIRGSLRARSARLLRPGDALVVNDTKVIPARLHGRRIGRGESNRRSRRRCIERLDGARWRAFVKAREAAAPGDVVRFGDEGQGLLSRPARCHRGRRRTRAVR